MGRAVSAKQATAQKQCRVYTAQSYSKGRSSTCVRQLPQWAFPDTGLESAEHAAHNSSVLPGRPGPLLPHPEHVKSCAECLACRHKGEFWLLAGDALPRGLSWQSVGHLMATQCCIVSVFPEEGF